MSNYQRAFLLALGFTMLGGLIYHSSTHSEPLHYKCDVYHENGPVGGKCSD